MEYLHDLTGDKQSSGLGLIRFSNNDPNCGCRAVERRLCSLDCPSIMYCPVSSGSYILSTDEWCIQAIDNVEKNIILKKNRSYSILKGINVHFVWNVVIDGSNNVFKECEVFCFRFTNIVG